MTTRWVLVGNPGCRRVGYWQAALGQKGLPPAQVVPYSDLLASRITLAEVVSPETVLRFESAAENWETYQALLHYGMEPAAQEGYPVLTPTEIVALVPERGWLIKPGQAHRGFVRLLQALQPDVERCGTRLLNHPAEILLQYDKPACQQRLAEAKIPVPRCFPSVASYAELRERYPREERLMVKLAYGSGGTGCIALHRSGRKVRAIASVCEVHVQGELRLYGCKRPQHLDDETRIARLVDRLCLEKVHVEQWLPKAQWLGGNFDLRIVTIAGQARHAVARLSRSPFTNLNLGNQRGDIAALVEHLGPQWEEIRTTAARTAAQFPRSFTLGLDLLVQPGFRRHVVLEVNAFGNLLPRLLLENEDTYTAAVSAWQARNQVPL
jgi:hypothetical protein